MRKPGTITALQVAAVALIAVNAVTLVNLNHNTVTEYNNVTETVVDDELSHRTLSVTINKSNPIEITTDHYSGTFPISSLVSNSVVPVEIRVDGDYLPSETEVKIGDVTLDYGGGSYSGEVEINSLSRDTTIPLTVKHKNSERNYEISTLPDAFPEVDFLGAPTHFSNGKYFYSAMNNRLGEDQNSLSQSFAIKYDTTGHPVFYISKPQSQLSDLQPWSSGDDHGYYFHELTDDHGAGHYVVLNDKYQEVIRHEIMSPTDQVNRVFTSASTYYQFLSPTNYRITAPYLGEEGKPSGIYTQEVKDGEIIWEWDSSRVPELQELVNSQPITGITIGSKEENLKTKMKISGVAYGDQGVYYSLPNLSTIINVKYYTTNVQWFAGGDKNQFEFPKDTEWVKPSGITLDDNGDLVVFDNKGYQGKSKITTMKLDTDAKKVEVVNSIDAPAQQGEAQSLGDAYLITAPGTYSIGSLYDNQGKKLRDMVHKEETSPSSRMVLK